MSRWIVEAERGSVIDRAVEVLKQALTPLLDGGLADGVDDGKSNIIVVGRTEGVQRFIDKGLLCVPDKSEGYGIFVGEADGRGAIIVGGYDALGVMHGVRDLVNKYLTVKAYERADIWRNGAFECLPLGKAAPYSVSAAPAVPTRAIWSWGHVIYDYRGFLDNISRLRMNEVVIWNDFVPTNARAVVEYAHGLGIRVVWGFAWGWSQHCEEFFRTLTDERLAGLTDEIIANYEQNYRGTGADGVYFQSFTEFNSDTVNGKCVAAVVVDFVNATARKLLKKYPDLHLQFGLHATSVKTKTDIIAGVDERVAIVWEDCGAFPYDYSPHAVDDFDGTLALTKRLLFLRGDGERFGAVLKGMLKLDWTAFRHADGSIAIGEKNREQIQRRKQVADKIWRVIRCGWLKNAECVRKTVELISQNPNAIVQALVEDGLLEESIKLPVAILAEALWSPQASTEDIIALAAAYSE